MSAAAETKQTMTCGRCGTKRGVKLVRDRHTRKLYELCKFCRRKLGKYGFELVVDAQ